MKNKKGNFFNRSHKNIENNNIISSKNGNVYVSINNPIKDRANNSEKNNHQKDIIVNCNSFETEPNNALERSENKGTIRIDGTKKDNKSNSKKSIKIMSKIIVPIILGLMSLIGVIITKMNFNCVSNKDSTEDRYTIENDETYYIDDTYFTTTPVETDSLPDETKQDDILYGDYTSQAIIEKTSSEIDTDESEAYTLDENLRNEKFIVTFDTNGGIPITDIKEVAYGACYGELPTPVKEGYVFAGWYTDETGGIMVTDKSRYRFDRDSTLYAHWRTKDSIIYTVSFDLNGGSCEIKNQEVEYGKEYGSLPTPSKAGSTFEGWYTAMSGGSRVTLKTVYNTAGNTTLYARWADVYVTSISLEKAADETVYYIGDNVSAAGAVLKVTYNDQSIANVSGSDCEIRVPDMSTEGSKTVTVFYDGKETSYPITVKKPTISITGGINGSISSMLTASCDAGKQQGITVNWSSSDTSVAKVDGNGKVTFNKNKNSNASSTITASYAYMGKTYSASRTVNISYGNWSGWSTTAASANDNRQVQTRNQSKTENTTSDKSSLAGWTLTGKSKKYTSDWSGAIYRYSTQKSNDDGNGTEYQLAYEDWRYFHYHNYNAGSIDSIEIANCLGFCEFFKDDTAAFGQGSATDRGGRPLSQNYWDYNHYNNCPYGYTAYWRDRNYIYRQRTYKYIYSYSKTTTWTEYSTRTINYTY